MAAERDFTLPAAWAQDANTTIPPLPVSGQSYRKLATDDIIIGKGSIYDQLADSSEFNQYQYLVGLISKELDSRGILGWSDQTVYDPFPALVRASDGNYYVSTANNGPGTGLGVVDPDGDVSGTWVTLADYIGSGGSGGLDALLNGFISGLELEWISSTVIQVKTGSCRDAGNTQNLQDTLGTFQKNITNPWAVGSGFGGRASGVPLTADTFYRYFIIAKPDGTIDYGFDTSATAVNLLADAAGDGFTLYRQIGWVLTDGGSNIYKFFQDGNRYQWDVPFGDFIGTVPQTDTSIRTISAPPETIASFVARLAGVGLVTDDFYMLVTETRQTDTAPSTTIFNLTDSSNVPGGSGAVRFNLFVDSSSQIRTRNTFDGIGGPDHNFTINTDGFEFLR